MAVIVKDGERWPMSWSAALAGCVISLVAYVALGVLGTAIGMSAADPLHDPRPFSSLPSGAVGWLAFSVLVSVFVGAYVAGLLATSRGALHGVISWAVTTLVTAWLVAGLAGAALSTASGVVGKGLSLTGEGVVAVAPSVAGDVKDELAKQGVQMDWTHLRGQLDELLRQTGKPQLQPNALTDQAKAIAQNGQATASQAAQTPQVAGDDLDGWFDRVRAEAKPTLDAADREALVNIIAARTGQSHDAAEQIAGNYVQLYNQAMARYTQLKVVAIQKLREAADVTARAVAHTAWITLLILVLGALIAALGGTLGWRRSDRTL